MPDKEIDRDGFRKDTGVRVCLIREMGGVQKWEGGWGLEDEGEKYVG